MKLRRSTIAWVALLLAATCKPPPEPLMQRAGFPLTWGDPRFDAFFRGLDPLYKRAASLREDWAKTVAALRRSTPGTEAFALKDIAVALRGRAGTKLTARIEAGAGLRRRVEVPAGTYLKPEGRQAIDAANEFLEASGRLQTRTRGSALDARDYAAMAEKLLRAVDGPESAVPDRLAPQLKGALGEEKTKLDALEKTARGLSEEVRKGQDSFFEALTGGTKPPP